MGGIDNFKDRALRAVLASCLEGKWSLDEAVGSLGGGDSPLARGKEETGGLLQQRRQEELSVPVKLGFLAQV